MKRAIIIICAIAIAFVFVCNCAVLGVSKGVYYNTPKDIPHCDYGILYGTGRSAAPSPYYQARINAAIDLLQAKKISALIISGENQYCDYNEVDSMAADIRAAVQDAEIYLDYDGTSTIATLKNAGDKFGYRSTYTMISQHFHNQRALYYGSLLFDNIPCAFDAADTQQWGWKLRNEIREILARTKCVIMTTRVVSDDKNDLQRPFVLDLVDSIPCTITYQTNNIQLFDSLKSEMEKDLPGAVVYDKVYIPSYKDEKTNDTLFPEDAWDHAYAYVNWYYADKLISLTYIAEESTTGIYVGWLNDGEGE